MSFPRTLCLATCLAIPSVTLGLELKSEGNDYGNIDFLAKAMAVVTAKDNGYDPNDGKSYLLKAKYTTPDFNGLKGAAGLYVNGDLFDLTDFGTERVARGMFVTDNGAAKGQLGEIYARYDNDRINAFGGRMMLDTPLTNIAYSNIPNFYTAFGVGAKAMDDLELGLTQITQMSFGSRSMTDFGLIGEATGTAGAAVRPNAPGLGQATFHNLGKIAAGPAAPDTDGITAISVEYGGIENTKLRLWDYYAHDVANNVYFDVDSKIPLQGLKALAGFQYLNQKDTGDRLRGNLDFSMFGLKAGVAGKGWSAWGAFNSSSGDTAMLNAWGGDPAYTSTIFSRNAYRENVDAWGLGVKYKIMKNLTFVAKHMRYSQSDTAGFGGAALPQDDANETDLVLIWKPKEVKGLMLKTFYANRTSEYDGIPAGGAVDKTQSHWRVIAAYKF